MRDSSNNKLKLNLFKIRFQKHEIHVSQWRAIAFVLIFAALGSYLLYSSFADTSTVQVPVASMTPLPSGASPYTDSSLSTQAVQFTSNATARTAFAIQAGSTLTGVTVSAHKTTTSCNGSPTVSLAMTNTNGSGTTTILPSTSVSSTSWTTYSPTTAPSVPSGTYTLSITAGNTGSKRCKRPLDANIISLTVTGQAPAPTIANFVATPTTITAGGSSSLTWTTTNATSCTAMTGSGYTSWNANNVLNAQTSNNTAISTGPLSTAGTYTFGLTCTDGLNGPSTTATASVVVSTAGGGGSTNPSLGTSLPTPLPASNSTPTTATSTSLTSIFSNLSPGETLCLPSGTYGQGLTSAVTLSASGTAANPITITSCSGQTATIAQLIEVTGSYIRLSHLKIVQNSYPTDSRTPPCPGGSSGNVGIWFDGGSHDTLEQSEITGNTMSGVFGGGPYDQILANYIHDNGTSSDDHGIYFTSNNSLIANNLIVHNYDFGLQLGYTATYNNIIANNDTVNNGFGGGATCKGSGVVTFSGTANNLFVNNIAAGNADLGYKTYDTANTLSHDSSYNNSGGTTYGSWSVNSLFTSNPLFVSSTDFHLQSGSSVINTGDPAYTPPTDYYGTARSSADLGAISH